MSELNETSLSIIIPAYNEENGITEIIERVLAVKPALQAAGISDFELIVVDDGSSDRTAEIVAGQKNVCLLRHPTNRGYGAALKTGFCAAKGELIGFLDADGTYPPEYFPQLCSEALKGAGLVVGSRRSGEVSGMPRMRRLGNFLWSNLVTLLGNHRVVDPASGMRVFHKHILERVLPLPDGLNLTPVMSTRAIHEGVHLAEVPIPYHERVGRSKLSVIRDGSLFLHSITWTVLTYNPERVLGLVGLAGLGLAFSTAVGLAAMRLSGVTQIGPWGVAMLLFALVAGVTGISVFSLGVTFNYLVSLFTKRPVRQGLFGHTIFRVPLDHQFGWMGLVGCVLGLGLGVCSLVLGVNGWEITRLWLYLLGSAMFVLVGVQLILSWILLRVLDDLSQREALTRADLGG